MRVEGSFRARGTGVTLAFVAPLLLAWLASVRAVPAEVQETLVYRLPIHGVIDLGLAPFVRRVLDEAVGAGAAFVVLDINTPGGRVDAMWEITDAVQDAKVPVYAYVDRALSAGAMIALAAERIYMKPGATLGAATPVEGTGEKAPEKVVSAMRSEARALAEARGLDPRVAEAMVDEEVEIPGVIEKGKLLTLTTEEAIRLGYAAGEPEDFQALLEMLDVRGAEIRVPEENWAEKIVRFLTNPIVAPLLLSLGLLGLLMELKTPSFGVAGVLGLLMLAAFFGAHLIVGLAGLEEVMLLVAGLILLAVEIFVIPGFGIAGILGFISIAAAIVLALLGRVPTGADVSQALAVLAATLVLFFASAVVLVKVLPGSGRLAGIFLRETEEVSLGYVSADPRPELRGRVGTALTDLRPAGIGLFDGERLDVVSEGGFVSADSRIQILRAEGYRLIVRPLEEPEPEA